MQTPYFIFKPEVLEKNFNELKSLCDKYLNNYVVAYSLKTNSYHELIKTLNSLGSHFEAASLDEINLVKNIKRLNILNGPAKTEEELKVALNNKSLINADSFSELDKIIKIIEGKKLEIGIRISLKESKFGFDETQLKEVFEKCNKNNLKIISLHFHCGTQLSLKEYENNLIKISKFFEKQDKILLQNIESFDKPQNSKLSKKDFDAISFGNEVKSKSSIDIKYINLGGGFPEKLKLKNLGCNLEDYFKLLTEYLDKIKKKYNVSIILEPGRVLVADAFDLITKVITIKNNFDETYAILDAGINVLPKVTLSNYKFSKLNQFKEFKTNPDRLDGKEKLLVNDNSKFNKKKQEYILAGPLLFNNDILGRFHGNLKENDLIKVENVGAYCYNLAWEISYKKPRIDKKDKNIFKG
ncbi:alanine racemase [Candidatus Pacearchaeota archaeon]|nr:alanine racemase [Candidatus Pacearchaeota archaeon]